MSARRYRLEAVVDGSRVDLYTDLDHADPCVQTPILVALGMRLGFEPFPEALRKAGGEKPDPRWPELEVLAERATSAWTRWTRELLRLLDQLWTSGMTPTPRHVRTIGEQLEHTIAGPGGHVDVAFALGRAVDPSTPRRRRDAPSGDLRRAAARVRLTGADRHALHYARTRAGVYVRKPVERLAHAAGRALTESELSPFRAAVAGAVERGSSSAELARALEDEIEGLAGSDFTRTARTELAQAHGIGAYMALKAEAGEPDPLVYKLVAPGACDDCRRIWGPPGDPHTYRLSHVEAREAAGGNIGLPREQWGPVVGPVHPNCTEGPLQLYREDLVGAINEAAAELDSIFGR